MTRSARRALARQVRALALRFRRELEAAVADALEREIRRIYFARTTRTVRSTRSSP